MKKIQIDKNILGYFLPEKTLDYFVIMSGNRDSNELSLVLEEKNNPPISKSTANKKIISNGFKDITINDYPIRGRKTILTFRRRYWKVEGEKELLKRDIKLVAEGTLLEKEFAEFLKK